MAAEQLITLEEIKKHTKEEDCWLVINGAQQRPGAGVFVSTGARSMGTLCQETVRMVTEEAGLAGTLAEGCNSLFTPSLDLLGSRLGCCCEQQLLESRGARCRS